MNIKDIAATLAILGSGALVMTGCGKDKGASEVPAGAEAVPTDGAEGSCASGHTEEGHCGDAAAEAAAPPDGDGSCSSDPGSGDGDQGSGDGEEASCGGK